MKRFWKVGIAVVALLALGGVAAGIVAAQTGGASTPTEQNATATQQSATPSSATPAHKQQLINDFLTRLAANLGISVDQLKKALTTTETQMIDQAVADGKITQAEADKIKAKIASGQAPLFPFIGRHGRGFGKFGEMGFVKETATFLGITPQVVITGLRNNQSLAQIAQAHGKTADELSSYLYDQLKSRLDTAVKNGKITQDQENTRLSNAKTRIANAISRVGIPGREDGDNDKGTSPNNATPSNSAPSGTANPTGA